MEIKDGAHIYFMGIAGTGMASVAGLCKEAGYQVTGSDAGIYPPMSTMLQELGIPVATPYAPENLTQASPDVVVVANALSRGHAELEKLLTTQIPYTSFPALCGDLFLSKRTSIVVTGTHGKTTTTSLIAHLLNSLGYDCGFIIGGIPKNFPRSFRLGTHNTFVIEGDEYDTAYFDKGPKFLHYRPHQLILNNIEFDHADIYENLDAIIKQFQKVCQLVPRDGTIIANIDDPNVRKVIDETYVQARVIRVATAGETPGADLTVEDVGPDARSAEKMLWRGRIRFADGKTISYSTQLAGNYNAANIAQAVACLFSLQESTKLGRSFDNGALINALGSFQAVQRRLELLARHGGIDVFEDFAHHPTAVKLLIEAFRKAFPSKRLVVAFEPKNATSRRNIFQNAYIASLSLADRVFLGPCPVDQRIAAAERMDTKALVAGIGDKAQNFASNEELLEALKKELKSGDAVIFMSSSSFSGIQHKLARDIQGN